MSAGISSWRAGHRRRRRPGGPERRSRARSPRRDHHGHRGARPGRRSGLDHSRRVRRQAARGGWRRLHRSHQDHVRQLARDLGLAPIRILRDGFGFYGPDARGRRRIQATPGGFRAVARLLHTEIADFRLAESRWDSAIAARLARQSVAAWLDTRNASPALRAGVRAFRGFFLADPGRSVAAATGRAIRGERMAGSRRHLPDPARQRPPRDTDGTAAPRTHSPSHDRPSRAARRSRRASDHRGPDRSSLGDRRCVPRLRAARIDGARRRLRPGVAGAPAAGHLALAIRVRDAHAAAVRAPILEEARPACGVRH